MREVQFDFEGNKKSEMMRQEMQFTDDQSDLLMPL